MKKTININKDQFKQIVIDKSGDYRVNLKGEGAQAEILGAFHLKGKDKLEVNVEIIHAARYTSADTIIKAIADDQSTATINGTIKVNQGAQQTNSFLTENILLLSDKAQAHAIPNLEILADDVKCSHAATVSNLDEEQIFYLQSRGIEESDAKNIIAEGFLTPVLDRMNSR